MKFSTYARALTGVLVAVPGVGFALAPSAGAATPKLTRAQALASVSASNADCGASVPTGTAPEGGTWTPVSSYAQLQSALNNSSPYALYLTKSLADSASTPGGLTIQGYVDLDLNGCQLSITHPGTDTAAIHGSYGLLRVSDTSAAQDGSLIATGGNAASASDGAAAGIGASSGASNDSSRAGFANSDNMDFTLDSGTVIATGGSVSGATVTGGSGAGLGGAGGTGSQLGGGWGGVVINGGQLIATGGSVTATGTANGGAGAGIGEGGNGNGSGNLAYYSSDTQFRQYGGTISATGGGVSTAKAGAGYAAAGLGGGGASSVSNGAAGDGPSTSLNGGVLEVREGDLTQGGTVISAGGAPGAGPGGGTSQEDEGQALFQAGTTYIVGGYDLNFYIQYGATVNVADHATVLINGASSADQNSEDDLSGTLNVPADATLQLADRNYVLGGAATINAQGNVQQLSGTLGLQQTDPVVGVQASATFAGSDTYFNGEFYAAPSTTVDIPSGAKVSINGFNSTNAGQINLGGTLTGVGILSNDGTITLTGPDATIPGHGVGPANELTITDNIYRLVYNTPNGTTPPADEWVYADDLTDGGETLASEPSVTGYTATGWKTGGGQPVNDGTSLSAVATGNLVGLNAYYSADNGGAGIGPATGVGLNGNVSTKVSTPTSSQSPATAGQPDVLSTNVTASNGDIVNAGEVAFFVNDTQTVCIGEVINGQATCVTGSLPAGDDAITAIYEGTSAYSGSYRSDALDLTVLASNQFSVNAVSALAKGHSLKVALKAPDAGTFTVATTADKRTFNALKMVRSVKKAGKVSYTLKFKTTKKTVLKAHHLHTVKVKLKITFKPKGGKARTITKLIKVRVS